MTSTQSLCRNTRRLISNKNQILNFVRHKSVWTPEKVVKSPFEDIVIPNISVPEHIWKNLDRWSDKTAVVCGFTGKAYTYHQLYKYSRNLAAKLRINLQIRNDDVICLMMPNLPEFPLVTLGALQAGAAVTTVNPIYTPHEVSRQILLSGAKVIICVSDVIPTVKKALTLSNKDLPIIVVANPGTELPSGTMSLKQIIEDDLIDTSILNEVNRTKDDVCFIPYSSGTTGLPKGVVLNHKNMVANCLQQDDDELKQYDDTTKTNQDNVLVVLPLFHIYGLSILMLHKLSVGTKLVTVPKFHADTFLKVLEKHKINTLYAAPPIVLFLANNPEVRPAHLDHVKLFMSAAAPLPLPDVEKLFSKAKRQLDFVQGYGLTETSPLVTVSKRRSEEFSSSGYAIANTELRIVNSELSNLGPDETGEVLIRGPQVMKGYKDNIEATRGCLTEDGWFSSGDSGAISENGTLTIKDRLKELIKVKGFQVPPAELEGVLKEHPDILDAAVIGVPDPRTGETPKAFVVLKNGHKADTKGIKEFVSERVAEYKRIGDVVFLEALPRNPSGKLLRKALREKYS